MSMASTVADLQFGREFNPTKVTDARGFITNTIYDRALRPKEKQVQYKLSGTTPVYAITKWTRDGVGNVLTETDPLNRVTTNVYDGMNRVIKTTYADNSFVQSFYTGTGLKWKTIDELGFDTFTEYDDAGRPVLVKSPLVDNGSGVMARAVTRTVYDKAGNVLQTINPLSRAWDFQYDNRNRKVKELRPAATGQPRPTLQWAYDAVGNVTKTTDPLLNATDMTYDAANRLFQTTQPPVSVYGITGTVRPVTTNEYDRNGNVTKVTDANGKVTTNTYDKLNRLVTTTDAAGIIVTNVYDEVGNRTKIIDGKSQATTFEYDGLKRNTKITDAAGKSTVFEFDAVNKTARVDAKSPAHGICL